MTRSGLQCQKWQLIGK